MDRGQRYLNWKTIVLSFKAQWGLPFTWRCRIECQMEIYGPSWNVDMFYGAHRGWFCHPCLNIGRIHIIWTFSFFWNVEVKTVPMHLALSSLLLPEMGLPVTWELLVSGWHMLWNSSWSQLGLLLSFNLEGCPRVYNSPSRLEDSPWVSGTMLWTLYAGSWIGLANCGYRSALPCVTQGA